LLVSIPPLEHRRFLDGPPLEFDGYTITFAKHDEAENAREYDLDHEVWLMLLGYPLYARSTSAIAKAVFGFGMLRHVHESEVMARVVIKACMNAESQVPPSVVVCVGKVLGSAHGRRLLMKMSFVHFTNCTRYPLRLLTGWGRLEMTLW
jgi:hypothetical protein